MLSAKKDDRFIEKNSVDSTGNKDYFDESSDQKIKQVRNFSAKPRKYQDAVAEMKNNPMGLVEESTVSYSTTPKKIEVTTFLTKTPPNISSNSEEGMYICQYILYILWLQFREFCALLFQRLYSLKM